MGPQNGGGVGEIDKQSLKHVLDSIGKIVHEKVKKEAANYRGKLYGRLKEVTFKNRNKIEHTDAKLCKLNYQYHTNVTDGHGKEHPCKDRWDIRFSDKYGGQCTNEKIHGNEEKERKDVGACAPFRRLHLCDQHLSHMKEDKIDSKDNLLLEVCLAAQYEGSSLVKKYKEYKQQNNDSNTDICTVLARSFADIGDIIRGKDLFRGYNEKDRNEKKQLQQNLKTIFGNIYNKLIGDLTTTNGSNGKKLAEAKDRYKKDEEDGNYFQLREDWWYANRKKVWDAITCKAGSDSQYFRKTCSNDTSDTKEKCRCAANIDPPTYFDYVPQYLRWFEEWAEDFCRKRKKQLTDAIQNCRYDEENKPKYCDLNGYNCKETASGKKKLVEGANCHDCSVTCIPFGPWIDNQRKEFEKQKNKYDEEIKKKDQRTITTTHGTINNMYVDVFYNKLQAHYPTVDKFLQKLNDESICKDKPQVGTEKADAAVFSGKNYVETFSHTTYCQACPWCGTEKKGEKWEPKSEDCAKENQYNPGNITTIEILTHEEGKTDMLEKYDKLCNSVNGTANVEKGKKLVSNGATGKKGNQIETWQCHYEENEDDRNKYSDNCILGNWQNVTKEAKIRPYVTFFKVWIHEMLEDSIKWREQLKKCINNKETNNCIRECKSKCNCFQKWVEHMRTEWEKIEKHFDKQKHTDRLSHYTILQSFLIVFFKDKIKEAYGEGKCKELEEKLNKIDGSQQGDTEHSNDVIKILLAHEQKEAEKCLKKHSEDKCKQQEQESRGRSLNPPPDSPPQRPPLAGDDDADNHSSGDEEEEEEEEDEDDTEESAQAESEQPEASATTEETTTEGDVDKGEKGPSQEDPKVCETVDKALTGSLKDACEQKYQYGKEKFPNWKCIPSGSESVATREGSDTTTKSVDTTGSGSICVPPRRRKLYVTPLTTWASGGNTVVSGQAQTPLGNVASTSSQNATHLLRDAFIQSAAIETFFAWDRYKKIKDKELEEKRKQQNELLTLSLPEPSPPGEDPQTLLQKGEIPPDFLRQMFYTLADYRDILVRGGDVNSGNTNGSNNNNIVLEASGSTEQEKAKMKKIQEKITDMLNKTNSGSTPSGQKTTPKEWWQQHAESIWNGMVCALTYTETSVSGDKGVKIEQNQQLKEQLLENGKSTPKKPQYQYGKVELKDEEQNGAKPQNGPKSTEPSSPSSGEKTPLTQFVERPPFFRWLHEWGSDFCDKRARMLEKIKEECMDGDGKQKIQKYSGDGEECEKVLVEDANIFSDLSSRCAKPCRKYRKWIEKKKTEYEKQQNAYTEQQKKCEKGSNKGGGNGVCGTQGTCDTAASFLKRLGPCKVQNGEDDIDFDQKDKTFGSAKNCKPCSSFKINCRNGKCIGGTKVECKDKTTIDVNDIENKGDSTQEVTMLVSDNSPNGFEDIFEECLLPECADAGIFEGIRKEEWKCRNVCGYIVCKPEKGSRAKENGENPIIQITALLQRWVENFVEDYNKIRHKISHCKENSEVPTCINGCVEQWITRKKEEWQQLRDLFLDQYKSKDKNEDEDFNLRSFLETFLVQIGAANHKDKVIKLSKFDNPCGCNAKASSEKKKDGNENDAIDCMLNKLEDKANKCKDQASGSKQCTQTTTDPTSVEDDEEDLLLEEEEKNTVEAKKNMIPKICDGLITQQKPTEEETCDPVTPSVPENEKKKEEEKEDKDGGPAGTPPSTPAAPKKEENLSPPSNVFDNPHVKTALVTSTLAWSVGIGFATFTYFYLKVLNIYMYMWGCVFLCGYVFVWIYIYVYVFLYMCFWIYIYVLVYMCFLYMYLFVCLDIYLCICMCFIYILYIYIYIKKEKNEKNEKKKKRI